MLEGEMLCVVVLLGPRMQVGFSPSRFTLVLESD